MTKSSLTTLRNELRQAGADDAEMDNLLKLGANLKLLKTSSPAKQSTFRCVFPYTAGGLAGLALGLVLVVAAQTVLPGNFLYPLQKATDAAVVSADPDYRATVMMKRADQVEQLVASDSARNHIVASLADYQSEAANYKSVTSNYAAFEYCKNSLKQAAGKAPPPERRAINSVLKSLDDV